MALSGHTIGVVGLWHLGSVYSAGLADLGHRVIGFDENPETIMNFQAQHLPVYEPELAELIKKNVSSGQLQFTNDPSALRVCDVIWLTIDTPLADDGHPDIFPLEIILQQIALYFQNPVTLVVSSQVPIGTAGKFSQLIKNIRPDLQFHYVYQPENLQLGQALKSFFTPSRIVIGADDQIVIGVIQEIFAKLNTPISIVSTASAEMIKHALNAFLGTSLSFIYDIADLCDVYGADVLEVSRALKSDQRIGNSAYLDASLGFSGGTLDRDLSILVLKAKEQGIMVPVIEQVARKNKNHWLTLIKFLESNIADLSHTTIGILGLTYKPGTSTLRHSLSIKVAQALVPLVKEIRGHDPLASTEEIIAEVAPMVVSDDVYTMSQGCSALLVMTASPEYKTLDFYALSQVLIGPKILFDAKNFLHEQEEEIKKHGLQYRGVGRGHSTLL